MPSDASSFSQPDDPNYRPAVGQGQGAPPDAVWDPIQQRWVGRSESNGPISAPGPRPPGTTWDMNTKQFVPASTQLGQGGDAGSTGNLPGAPQNEGQVTQAGAWGGYAGTVTRNPDGSLNYDRSLSGANADVDRYQGLGAAAANRGAYQTDYSNANAQAANAQGARVDQGNAIGMADMMARHGDYFSQQLGQRMLAQGAQAQQAGALSTRGGSLAAAAALRNQQNGQAAFYQQGQNQLRAQQADDMARGRDLYAGLAAQQRAGDAAGQSLHQGQAIGQMNNELGQRQLNDQTQQGYEGLAQGVNHENQQGALTSEETDAGIASTNDARGQAERDRNLQIVGTGASMVGTVLGGAAGSDERMKQHTRPMSLASAAMARKGMR